MSDIKMSECCTCGAKWRTSHDGRHSCTQTMALRIKELEAALTKQKRALDGAMSQLSRPCNSINDLSFIAFVGVVEKEINDLLKESE